MFFYILGFVISFGVVTGGAAWLSTKVTEDAKVNGKSSTATNWIIFIVWLVLINIIIFYGPSDDPY